MVRDGGLEGRRVEERQRRGVTDEAGRGTERQAMGWLDEGKRLLLSRLSESDDY